MAAVPGYGGDPPTDEPTCVLDAEERGLLELETVESLGMRGAESRAAAAEPPQPATIGRHVILRRLGAGGMGVVYLATDPELDRLVAIKAISRQRSTVPRTEAAERLEREARALARLRHPNVVAIHDVGRQHDAVFVVMEYVEGSDLRRWLSEQAEPRPWRTVVDVFVEAGQGLAAVHEAGLVHRDFKPANVLIASDHRVLVTDFGLAREAGGTERSASSGSVPTSDLTATGTVMGTPAFLSPELLDGTPADARSDQFAFCVSLWQGLYGRRPFEGRSVAELRRAMAAGPPSPPPGSSVPRWLHRTLRRGLHGDPARRWPSMEALLRRLRRGRRGALRSLAAATAVLGTAGLVAFAARSEAAAPCEDATSRVEAVWSPRDRQALQIGGDDYTAAHARQARAAFERTLDEYSARWSTAYERSCAVVGPRGERGTAAQQATAQCLENRLGSLRGMVELATTSPLDASRVDDVVRALPAIEDCTSGAWVPYPAGPGEAARAAALDERITAIRRARFADRLQGITEDAEATVREARALGDAYRLARALGERARVLGDSGKVEEALPGLHEALELAIAAGHDHLAAYLANDALLVALQTSDPSWREAQQLSALARGLVARAGGDDELLGNVSLNQGSMLRWMARHEEAMTHDERAEQLFARAGSRQGVAKARYNRIVSLVRLHRFEEAEQQLDEVSQELAEALGEASKPAITSRTLMVSMSYMSGRSRQAVERSRQLYRMVREHYVPGSITYHQVACQNVMVSLSSGELDVAERTLGALRSERADPARRLDHEILATMIAMARRRDDRLPRLLQTVDELSAEVGDPLQRAWVRVARAQLDFIHGELEATRARLVDQATWTAAADEQVDEGLRLEAALLAVLAEAPVPEHATSWPALLHVEELARPADRPLLEVIEAVQSGADPTAVIQHAREQLARMYFEEFISVQVLDAWLDQRR